jgi:dienelactone hydrolase
METAQASCFGRQGADMPAYDAAASERHWQTMLALFDATLRS